MNFFYYMYIFNEVLKDTDYLKYRKYRKAYNVFRYLRGTGRK